MRALIGTFGTVILSASVIQVTVAAPPLPSNPTPTRLEGYCNENGGTYSPPNSSGYYACILPDGTVIACGGSISGCSTIAASTGLIDQQKLPLELINTTLVIQSIEETMAVKTQLDALEAKVNAMGTKLDAILNQCPFVP